ncbi:hypothetical protein FGO68_gene899 [Halteria grandinella]|uniref:Uncharacterized protein n=1 Tax=Halteria grandinella TaxID=5974 RepID=A0A8J8NZ85_HALGN|nr:hypothetical protein FGO68_gene899 [Halteria grandinella]
MCNECEQFNLINCYPIFIIGMEQEQQNEYLKKSTKNQLDKLLDSIERRNIESPHGNPKINARKNLSLEPDTTIKQQNQEFFNLNDSMNGLIEEAKSEIMFVEDKDHQFSDRQSSSKVFSKVPHIRTYTNGPDDTQFVKKQEGQLTQMKDFIQYKHNQIKKTVKMKKGIDKLKQDMVKRALSCVSLGRIVDRNEYAIVFRWFKFFKYLIYHLLFQIIGPFTVLFVTAIDSHSLSFNLGFTVKTNFVIATLNQYMFWFYNIYLGVIWSYYYKYPEEGWLGGIFEETFYFYMLHVVIKCVVTSVRYGFFSDLREDMFKQGLQTISFIGNDIIQTNWLKFHPLGGLKAEIKSSLYRNHVQERFFTLNFIEVLDNTSAKRLSDENYYYDIVDDPALEVQLGRGTLKFFLEKRKDELNEYTKRNEMRMLMEAMGRHKNGLEQTHTLENEFYGDLYYYQVPELITEINGNIKTRYSGTLMMNEIALFAGAKQMTLKMPWIMTVIRVLLPFMARYYEYGNPVHGFGTDSYVYTALDLILNSFHIYFNYIFIYAGLIDFHRRVKIMSACGALIDPVKENLDIDYRIFPTVNFFDVHSLHSWYQMRQCLMDLGKRYLNAIFIYSSFFLAGYLGFLIYRMLAVFEFIEDSSSSVFFAYATYDQFLFLANILLMLYYGACVNQQFVTDQLLLVQLKTCVILVKKHISYILTLSDEDFLEDTEYDDQYFIIIARQLIAYRNRKPNMSNKQIKQKLERLIKEIDIIRERLDIESNHHPLRIMGLKATFELMNQIYTGLITLAGAVIQQVYTKNSS